MKNGKILVVGSANMDLVVTAEHFPQPGETVMGEEFNMSPGGKGANQAVCCARLGAGVFFIGKTGNDLFGDRLRQTMQAHGVRLEHLRVDPVVHTGVALITLNHAGQNEIVVAPGSNMHLTPEEIRSEKELFSGVNLVMAQLEIPLETVIESALLAREQKIPFILNPAPARALPDELFKMMAIITPNETELEILAGHPVRDVESAVEAARILLLKGVENAVVTLGEEGALWVSRETERHYPVHKVEVVDTTAAGDAFNGGLAFSLAAGKPMDEAIRFANRVAAISVTRKGAQNSMPSLKEVQNLLKV